MFTQNFFPIIYHLKRMHFFLILIIQLFAYFLLLRVIFISFLFFSVFVFLLGFEFKFICFNNFLSHRNYCYCLYLNVSSFFKQLVFCCAAIYFYLSVSYSHSLSLSLSCSHFFVCFSPSIS